MLGPLSLVLDLSAVSYIDSASIGCIMDIRRLAKEKGGGLHILAPQARVETMLSMAGVHKSSPSSEKRMKLLGPLPRRPATNDVEASAFAPVDGT